MFTTGFTITRIIKPYSVYLVSENGEEAILKLEILTGLDRKGSLARAGMLARMNNKTPQVKKTIMIAGKIISHVTSGSTALGDIQTFNGWDTLKLAKKVFAAEEKIEGEEERQFTELINENVFSLLPLFRGFGTLESAINADDEVPNYVIDQLKHDPRCMRSLGHILVCDAFLGNVDRFGRLGINNDDPRGREAYVGQPKNVFLSWDRPGGNLEFLGIDFFDTQRSNFACYLGIDWTTMKNHLRINANNALSIDGKSALFNFELLKKGHDAQRDAAARWAIAGLGNAFRPRYTYNPEAVRELREGMREGRTRLESFYKRKMYKVEWPAGLESRFKACGW